MKFHDGVEVTADDVKFTMDYHSQWKAPFFVESLQNLESVETTGKYSLRIRLKEPYAPFIPNLLGAIFIIPKHIWQDIPDKVDVSDPLNYANEKPIGSGPFKFDYWDRGREMKVTAVKEHFSAPKCDGHHPHRLRQPRRHGRSHRKRRMRPHPLHSKTQPAARSAESCRTWLPRAIRTTDFTP